MAALTHYFSSDLIAHLIIFQAALLLITLWNIFLTRSARRHQIPDRLPMVSILVPARNEEANISPCVLSLLEQDYPNFELIVLDDRSTDQTRVILDDLSRTHPDLKIMAGKPGPTDQAGKNWACSQLVQAAEGDLFFFTDADTLHHPRMLTGAVASLAGENADLITGYPRQILGSAGEKLLVPFFSWAVLAFFPLGIAYRIKSPIFTTAVGQMMLFRREAYLAVGGHEGVSASIVDDLALARKIHVSGLRWRVVSIADLICCRMYRNSKQALDGFAKNLFAAFQFRLLPFLFSFIWLAILFLEPPLVLILNALGKAPLADPARLISCILLAAAVWAVPYLHLRLPVWLAILYPATVTANLISAARSLLASLRGELVWKDRVIRPTRWKWF